MRAAIDEAPAEVDCPANNWRHILFNWNDNDRDGAGPAPAAEWASIARAGRSPIIPSTHSRRFAPRH
jgi:hypothetical protein